MSYSDDKSPLGSRRREGDEGIKKRCREWAREMMKSDSGNVES